MWHRGPFLNNNGEFWFRNVKLLVTNLVHIGHSLLEVALAFRIVCLNGAARTSVLFVFRASKLGFWFHYSLFPNFWRQITEIISCIVGFYFVTLVNTPSNPIYLPFSNLNATIIFVLSISPLVIYCKERNRLNETVNDLECRKSSIAISNVTNFFWLSWYV